MITPEVVLPLGQIVHLFPPLLPAPQTANQEVIVQKIKLQGTGNAIDIQGRAGRLRMAAKLQLRSTIEMRFCI